MKIYLLTYNPEKGDFRDYEGAVRLTCEGRPDSDDWRVINSQIEAGDWVFVLRQGTPGKNGILAEGFATSNSYRSTKDRNGQGAESYRIDVELRTVLAPDQELLSWPLPGREYPGPFKGPFGSGHSPLSKEIAEEIERWWANRSDRSRLTFTPL